MAGRILCLEGEKSGSPFEKQSVRTTLEFLNQACGIAFDHYRVATRAELEHRLAEFSRSKSYSLLYLGFRSSPAKIEMAREEISLEDLGALAAGRWDKRLLHLGCGSLLKVPPKQIEAFRKATGAAILSGYAASIEFFPASILEQSYFQLLDTYRTPEAIARHLGEQQKYWIKKLAFKMF